MSVSSIVGVHIDCFTLHANITMINTCLWNFLYKIRKHSVQFCHLMLFLHVFKFIILINLIYFMPDLFL